MSENLDAQRINLFIALITVLAFQFIVNYNGEDYDVFDILISLPSLYFTKLIWKHTSDDIFARSLVLVILAFSISALIGAFITIVFGDKFINVESGPFFGLLSALDSDLMNRFFGRADDTEKFAVLFSLLLILLNIIRGAYGKFFRAKSK